MKYIKFHNISIKKLFKQQNKVNLKKLYSLTLNYCLK